jgi:CheY-like chemotaxis protein
MGMQSRCAAHAGSSMPNAGDGAGSMKPGHPLRVLIVDDNRDAAESMQVLLEIAGHEVILASDGHAALRMGAAFAPDVIVLDIGMPGMDGYETCRALRKEPWGSTVTAVALTGWGQDTDRRASKDAGFDGHLVKPAGPDELMTLLAALRNTD